MFSSLFKPKRFRAVKDELTLPYWEYKAKVQQTKHWYFCDQGGDTKAMRASKIREKLLSCLFHAYPMLISCLFHA